MLKKFDNVEHTIGRGPTGIHHTAVIHPDVYIGDNVKIGPHCVIGYDGFNYNRDKDGTAHIKEHKGTVYIHDDVEIHSNVCIDRGLTGNTVLQRGVKIDNLVHVAHDVIIGHNTMVVAGTVIGGEVIIGKNNFIGIGVGIKPKVTIGNCNLIGMNSVVLYDIEDHQVWCGNPAEYLRANYYFIPKGKPRCVHPGER